MTEVRFNTIVSGEIFSASSSAVSSKSCEGIDCFLDNFWSEKYDFLDPSQLNVEEQNSQSSTKSTDFLDSKLPTSPHPTQSLKWEGVLGGTTDIDSNTKAADCVDDTELEETMSTLVWPIEISNQMDSKPLLQTNTKPIGEIEFLHDDVKFSPQFYLENQLESTNTAWTGAIELPALVADDFNHLLWPLSTNSKTPSPIICARLPFKRKLNRKWQSISYSRPQTDMDTDSTETCSEAEHNAALDYRQQPRKKRMLIGDRLELVEDVGCSTTDYEEEDESGMRPKIPIKKRTRRRNMPIKAVPQQPSIVNDTEPWWPKRTGLAPQLEGGRNRRQFELWEFILRSLDGLTAKKSDSGFQWVDRRVGVFRVIDTQKAANEWGRYRRNARMDYEKMARAMRFYYKDSILRKARRQLHFQFAMPFVQWSELQHSLSSK